MGTFALKSVRAGAFALALGVAAAGCDDEPAEDIQTGLGGGKKGKKGKKAKKGGGVNASVVREPVVYRDEDFVESDRNRDPFRSYMNTFSLKAPDQIQRRVVMPTTTIEAMKLIAIITGTSRPRAMIVDTAGVGHVVERGMYIGRPKVIQATGSVSMTLNWRVERIRENEVLLTRQDPVDPGRPPLTRVIPLNEEVAKRGG